MFILLEVIHTQYARLARDHSLTRAGARVRGRGCAGARDHSLTRAGARVRARARAGARVRARARAGARTHVVYCKIVSQNFSGAWPNP
jgi:hypothetical protein